MVLGLKDTEPRVKLEFDCVAEGDDVRVQRRKVCDA